MRASIDHLQDPEGGLYSAGEPEPPPICRRGEEDQVYLEISHRTIYSGEMVEPQHDVELDCTVLSIGALGVHGLPLARDGIRVQDVAGPQTG